MCGKTRTVMISIALAIVFILTIFSSFSVAQASPAQDAKAVQGILQKYHSTMPVSVFIDFKQQHSDFDIAGALTVLFCESSLGTTGGSFRHNNPGNIKFGGWDPSPSKPWLLWMNGYWNCKGQGRYGTYSTMAIGTKADVYLLYRYNASLRSHNWSSFANSYFGRNVPGIGAYKRNLAAAHSLIVRLAKTYGAIW